MGKKRKKKKRKKLKHIEIVKEQLEQKPIIEETSDNEIDNKNVEKTILEQERIERFIIYVLIILILLLIFIPGEILNKISIWINKLIP